MAIVHKPQFGLSAKSLRVLTPRNLYRIEISINETHYWISGLPFAAHKTFYFHIHSDEGLLITRMLTSLYTEKDLLNAVFYVCASDQELSSDISNVFLDSIDELTGLYYRRGKKEVQKAIDEAIAKSH